jgi:hypothetical protein
LIASTVRGRVRFAGPDLGGSTLLRRRPTRGKQAEKILVRRMAAGDLPVPRMKDFAIVINMNVARKLKRFLPLELLQIAA